MIDSVMGGSMPVNKEVELASTARTGLIVLSSLLAWMCEALLLFHLRSARSSPDGAPALLYLLPVVNLLSWASAMQSLWRVRRDVRSGALDAAGASRCFWVCGPGDHRNHAFHLEICK